MSESSVRADLCAASQLEGPDEGSCCSPLAVRGRECGVSCVEHPGLWEAEQGYEAQMDVRATSVPPPGRVLSAEMLPHTLDGRRREERKGAFFAEFKKTRILFFL